MIRAAPALMAASNSPTVLARLIFTWSPGSRAAFCTPPLEARWRTTSGLNAASALAAASEPQSADTTSTSGGSGSPQGWLWSSITRTFAFAATSSSTVCVPMKPAPPVTATRTLVRPFASATSGPPGRWRRRQARAGCLGRASNRPRARRGRKHSDRLRDADGIAEAREKERELEAAENENDECDGGRLAEQHRRAQQSAEVVHHVERSAFDGAQQPAAGDAAENPAFERGRGGQLEKNRRQACCDEKQTDRDPAYETMTRQRDQDQRHRDEQEEAVQPLEGHHRRTNAERYLLSAAPQVGAHVVAAGRGRDGARGLADELDGDHREERDPVAEEPHDDLRPERPEQHDRDVEREGRDQRPRIDLLQRSPDGSRMADPDHDRTDGDADDRCDEAPSANGARHRPKASKRSVHGDLARRACSSYDPTG